MPSKKLTLLAVMMAFLLAAPPIFAAGGGSGTGHFKNLHTPPATVAEVLNDEHSFKGVSLRGHLVGNRFFDSSSQEPIPITARHSSDIPRDITPNQEVEIRGMVMKSKEGGYSIMLSRPLKVLEE